jgi:hypothetical protein
MSDRADDARARRLHRASSSRSRVSTRGVVLHDWLRRRGRDEGRAAVDLRASCAACCWRLPRSCSRSRSGAGGP